VAYIRNIKQSFFTSEDVVALSMAARLLYIGLWHEADREGRFRWKPVAFRLRYLPTDPIDIDAVCAELVERKLVVRYAEGLAYIPSFLTHQRPNAREAKSELPTPTGENTVETPVSTGENSVREGKEREGKEREVEGKGRPVATATFPTLVPMSNDAWQETIADWNHAVTSTELPAVSTNPASRQRIVSALKACPDLGLWRQRYDRVARSAFLRGTNDRAWTADFWWVLEHGDNRSAPPEPKAEDSYWATVDYTPSKFRNGGAA
jgi:hypothetical protein